MIKGEKKADKVHFVELLMDSEIKKCIIEHCLGEKWIDSTENNKADYIEQDIKFWYYLGYDYVRISGGIKFPGKGRKTEDTAILSKGKRNWVEENTGMITSWEDFEKYPWQKNNKLITVRMKLPQKNYLME